MNDLEILQTLLNEKRSRCTKTAYESDLKDFAKTMYGQGLTPEVIGHFLSLGRFEAVAVVLHYKNRMIQRELKEATINRRLSALKALAKLAFKVGRCNFTLDEVKGEKVEKYRDTSGVDVTTFKQVLALCDRNTLTGKRDYAILRLLWDNALRRSEVTKSNIQDFNLQSQTLTIKGKGKGTQLQVINLAKPTAEAINDYLLCRDNPKNNQPLFISKFRTRLSGEAIRQIVVKYCRDVGVTKQMSPHRVRHSAITAALDATDGNVRKVQKLSRHAKLDTLMIYDDNRQRHQSEVSDLLAELV